MKHIFLVFLLSVLTTQACTPLKRAQTGAARAIAGSVEKKIGGHEVYCSEGKVCAEIDVLEIDAEDRDGGRVLLTLKNRTGNAALIQIRLQIKQAGTGKILAETRAENFPIPSTQEKVYTMPGVMRKGATVRVLLNVAH